MELANGPNTVICFISNIYAFVMFLPKEFRETKTETTVSIITSCYPRPKLLLGLLAAPVSRSTPQYENISLHIPLLPVCSFLPTICGPPPRGDTLDHFRARKDITVYYETGIFPPHPEGLELLEIH